MARMCLGSQLPQGTPGKVYLQRNVQGGASSCYEVWDVTNVSAPVLALKPLMTPLVGPASLLAQTPLQE